MTLRRTGLLLLFIAQGALAAWNDQNATKNMCEQDLSVLCPDDTKDVYRFANCLHKRFREGSRGCQDWVEYNTHSRGALPAECVSDARRLSGPYWLARSVLEQELKKDDSATPECRESLATQSSSDTRVVYSPSYSFLRNFLDTLALWDVGIPDRRYRKAYHDGMLAFTASYINDREDAIRKAANIIKAAGDSIRLDSPDAAEMMIREASRAVLQAVDDMNDRGEWPPPSPEESHLLILRADAFFGNPTTAQRASISDSISDMKKWLAAH